MKHRIGANFAFLLLAGSCVPGMLFSQAVEAPKQNPAQALNLQTQGQPAGQVQDLQSPGQQNGKEPPDPQLKPNPLEVLRNFEPAADEEYRLGKGDEIAVDFVGRPDLATRLVIGPDGRITLPLAGDLVLSGQTRGEAARAIEAALSSYYSNLSAEVSVTKYTANRVLLLGAVSHPGMITFDGTPTLLEALSRGGLETGTNNGTTTTPAKPAQIPERCAIYRGRDQVVWVELKSLIESGNALADLRLRRDDVIYVPNGAERFISILGEVQHPGAVPLTNNSTLASVLAEAGGFTGKAGNKPHIQIVDPAKSTSRVISFNDVLNPTTTLEITLKPGEIIFVPQSGFYRATYFLERINPMTSVATMAMVVAY
ncbi:MAG: polysaccharide biosynthesis/export family protein [Terracidiphilus sp.]|jgi:polysaccharide export outer membrane protein